MRDIRPDLRERVEELDSEIRMLTTRLDALRQTRAGYLELLDAEELRWLNTVTPSLSSRNNGRAGAVLVRTEPKRGERSVLSRLIFEALADGKPHSEQEVILRAFQEQYDFAGRSAQPVVHFAMNGLGANRQLVRVDKGVWRLPNEQDSDRAGDPDSA